MKPLTKWQERRARIEDEHWLRFHGDVRRPKFAARQARRALGLRVAP
jgi:hypothetical protein